MRKWNDARVRFRIAYDHRSDGSGSVTRSDGVPLDEREAIALARTMLSTGDYLAVSVERQRAVGARWDSVELAESEADISRTPKSAS